MSVVDFRGLILSRNISASSGMKEQRVMIRSILILKQQLQQDGIPSSDSDAEVFDGRGKRPSKTKRDVEDTTTQGPTSASLTPSVEHIAPTAGSPAAEPAAVKAREDQLPERSGVPAAQTEAELPKDIDTSTVEDSSQTASDFVLLSRTNSNSQIRQGTGLETQSSQRQESVAGPVSQDKAKGVKLLLFTVTPSIMVLYSTVRIDWFCQEAKVPESEIRELVTLNKADGLKSVFASLEALQLWERVLIGDFISRLGDKVTMVSVKRTEHDLREGSISLNGVPSFQLIAEQPTRHASKEKLARPTYIKVARWHVYPETLDEYNLPWTWDDVSTVFLYSSKSVPCKKLT